MAETEEPKKKRRYNYSAKQKAKIAAQRAVKRAEAASQLANKEAAKLRSKAHQIKKRADKKRADKRAVKEALEKGGVLTDEQLLSAPPSAQAVFNDEDIIFSPHEGPQTAFLAAPETEVLYGGAAGGGKSYAMLADPLRYAHNPSMRALLLRKTMPELIELIDISRVLYPKAFPGAKFQEQKGRWLFPSGATLQFSFVDADKDVFRFMGQAFTWIGVDELGHFSTPFVWNYLRSRLRRTDQSIIPYMRACVDEGEVLTVDGWKDIAEVTSSDKVHSLDAHGALVIKQVTSVSSYDIDEDITRVRKKNLYMSMTNDHRVLYKKHGSDVYKISRWTEHTGKSIQVARTSTSYNTHGNLTLPGKFTDSIKFAKFLGLYIAEGSFGKPRGGNYKVIITQLKKQNHKFVESILDAYTFCYSKNGDFQITNKELWEYVEQFGRSYDKHFPRDFLNTASYEQLTAAFEAYILGDGNWQSDTACTAYTTSPQLVDDLQEIAAKLGYKTQYKKYVLPNINHNDKYCVYFNKKSVDTRVDKAPANRDDTCLEPYKGKVYCITVQDTESFVLRQKGCVWISSNTANPGGLGGWWIKKMFVEPEEWDTPFWATDIDTNKTLVFPDIEHVAPELRGKPLFRRRFIPAKLTDNPSLMQSPDYMAMLASLPEVERKRLLEGDWDVSEDSAFPEFRRDTHVIKSFSPPAGWTRFRACDYGYVAWAAVLWFAIDYQGVVHVYKELYQKGLNAEQLAERIKEMEADEPRPLSGPLDNESWARRGQVGPTIAETMIQLGVSWQRADKGPGSRKNGKAEVHRMLSNNEEFGHPWLQIHDNCHNLARVMPMLPLNENDIEDVDTKYKEDHLYDALRYGIMSRMKRRAAHPTEVQYMHQIEQYRPSDEVFGY